VDGAAGYHNELEEKRAWVIFKKYQDQPFSYTDCSSLAVMERHKLKTPFAFDTHFEIFGFKIAPPMTSKKPKVT